MYTRIYRLALDFSDLNPVFYKAGFHQLEGNQREYAIIAGEV